MYCKACGKELHDSAVVCVACGVGTENKLNGAVENESGLAGWSVLGFFIPVLALILYLIWKDEKPLTARAVGKGGIIYLIVIGAIMSLYFIIFLILMTGVAVSM